ncbi:acetyl-CoA carboxylase biotin carboxyl carrier protein [Methylopila capsulata]|uniref:Biotin carboxyl carrier protein of acetyl-CoA carboxylase n=1 Tax=Methylopila capsulata TaxID=61654 RepID=A0A9W6IRP6_9HYPH|nr:acetyl-CoA carboxylase biotin carboxyl carrier protein [Methylopila capsulata]MBM7849971.1 acetyl-CoA carboxylase biotin carboxyl carrier protein [Methylopila capsulata]GLK55263.1 acetyl-CoA carboxylase, biotin carboxyl carrier protein [Methylopila capsulata]
MSKLPSKASIDQELIRELAKLLSENDLTEIEIEHDQLRVRVARHLSAAPTTAYVGAAAPAAAPAAPAVEAPIDPAKHPGAVLSPMVGTAYMSPEPGARAFVEVGQTVRQGQTLLIVEAMKTMNAIPATRAGIVREILIADGQPVEFGEPLLIVD